MRQNTNTQITSHDLMYENKQLRTRIEELDIFAQTVAHDLRTPIATIRGFASLIQHYRERLSREEVYDIIELILDESHNLEEMVDSILLFSRISSVEQDTLELLNTHEIIEKVRTSLTKIITQHRAKIITPDSWPTAFGYSSWVERVWMNYISNAIKYGGKPPIVELGAKPLQEGQIMFWVRDNGSGLTEEQQDKIFTPFTRLNKHQKAKGHGLGLAIVTSIVEKLGGEVGVESQIGVGSTFSFTLPDESHQHIKTKFNH